MNTCVESWMSVAIAGLKAATVEERAEFLGLLGPAAVAAPAQKPKAPRAKVVKMSAPLPEQPTADDYRLKASAIDESVCVARKLTPEAKDTRWRPFVYREEQCGGALVAGSDLCSRCGKNETKYAAEPKAGAWTGRVTEDPLGWVHMLGTEWAEEKKPKFTAAKAPAPAPAPASAGAAIEPPPADSEFAFPEPATATATATATEAAEPAFASSSSSVAPAAPAVAPAAKAVTAAEKAAAKAAEKAAAKEKEKAAKAAAKEAEKAAIKAINDKAKADAAAAKAALKAAKPAAKAATAAKTAAKAAPAPAAAVKVASASAAAASEPVSVEGELELIDGNLYMVKNGNVYEYDELTEKAGDFVGRFTAEKTIDTEGEEVKVAESDTE